MTAAARRRTASSLVLPVGFAAGLLLVAPALAADDASTPPELPKHEMGGNDAKPGFVDMGKHTSGVNEQGVPKPGKAAGASSPDAPPVPSSR